MIPGMSVARVHTNSITADVNEKRIKVLIGPTFCAAIKGKIRPRMEQPLHIAKLQIQPLPKRSGNCSRVVGQGWVESIGSCVGHTESQGAVDSK